MEDSEIITLLSILPLIVSGLAVLYCSIGLFFMFIEKGESEIVKKQARELKKFSERNVDNG
tara:strand:+ start:172 stop:354 length:183 start_codon:yes stop_codon:yes gene_type:complete